MPHIIIEHDRDIEKEIQLSQFATSMHQCLASQDSVKEAAIKTRTMAIDNVIVGTSEDANKMIHITVLLLAGRSDELKETMAKALHYKAKEILGDIDCSLTVNVDELAIYVK